MTSTLDVRGGTLSVMLRYASDDCTLCVKAEYVGRTLQFGNLGLFEFGYCWANGLLVLGHV